MTAQILDRLRYAGREYFLMGVRGDGLFDPARLGLKVRTISSACFRGFHCSYTFDSEDRLLVQEVYLGLDEEEFPHHRVTLFGRMPQRYMQQGHKLTKDGLVDHAWMSTEYRLGDLSERMAFDGQMLIGTGYLEGIRELIFEGGRLVSELDGEAVVDRILHRARDPAPLPVSSADIKLWTAKLSDFGHRTLGAANMRGALRARETCTLEVVAGDGLDAGLNAFKIYVNGNIRGPRPGVQDKAWDRMQVLSLEPGTYRIVLRGKDVNDPHRLESNTMHFSIASGERLKILTRMKSHALTIEVTNVGTSEVRGVES